MRIFRKLLPALAAIAVFAALAGTLIWAVNDSNRSFREKLGALPEGEKVAEYASPDGASLLTVYYIEGWHATVSDQVRATVTADGSTWNIYYDYRQHETRAEWLDDETVEINGHVLNIHEDTYIEER